MTLAGLDLHLDTMAEEAPHDLAHPVAAGRDPFESESASLIRQRGKRIFLKPEVGESKGT